MVLVCISLMTDKTDSFHVLIGHSFFFLLSIQIIFSLFNFIEISFSTIHLVI